MNEIIKYSLERMSVFRMIVSKLINEEIYNGHLEGSLYDDVRRCVFVFRCIRVYRRM